MSVIDTNTNAVVSSIAVRNPRAVAITNNGDGNDGDETAVVTEFYGRTNSNREATDNSRATVLPEPRAERRVSAARPSGRADTSAPRASFPR